MRKLSKFSELKRKKAIEILSTLTNNKYKSTELVDALIECIVVELLKDEQKKSSCKSSCNCVKFENATESEDWRNR